ncbi:MAG: hypothetical protein P4L49_20470 [Desulfosporosinus sp.]|nr:hypothetical protein [Desulfosporosinus sp.]
MENFKLMKCSHCGTENHFVETFGKFTLCSYPLDKNSEIRVSVITCLHCSNIELFSPDLAENVLENRKNR